MSATITTTTTALVVFRVGWGFVGGRASRFADFMPRWDAIGRHVRGLARLAPPRTIGHNPLGGLMVLAFLADIAVVIVTGLFAAGEDSHGPLAPFVPRWLGRVLAEIHEGAANLLILLIIGHVLGVLIESLLTRENLVRAMWTGRKRLSPQAAAALAPSAGMWRAASLAALVGAVLVLAFARTDFTALTRPM